MAIVGVAVILHLVGLPVGTARVVHHHHEGAVERMAHGLVVELLRGVLAGLAHGLAVLVLEGVGKLLHRVAQRDGQHVIDRAEHLSLAGLNVALRLLGSHHLAQFQTKLAQLRGDQLRHTRGVLCGVGLRHGLHRHDTILLSQVGSTTERTAVIERIFEEELHALVVNGFIGAVDHALQHQVGLLQLVVEGEIDLTVLTRILSLCRRAKLARSTLRPRTASSVPNSLRLWMLCAGGLHAEVGVQTALLLEVQGQVVDLVGCQRIADHAVTTLNAIALDLCEHLAGDAATLSRRLRMALHREAEKSRR